MNKVFEKVTKIKEDKEGENMLMAPIEKNIVELCEDALLQYRQYMLELYSSMKQI